MRLGVIIPTYDNVEGLKALLQSIFEHTHTGFKVYIINDNPKKKIDPIKLIELGKIDGNSKVTYLAHEKNQGVATSWNDGIARAYQDGCTYFALMNDDITLCPNWWDACYREFEKGAHLVALDQPCPIPIITGWFFVLDKYCIEKVGLFDEQFTLTSEDTDYAYRFMDSGLKHSKLDIAVEHHHGGSTTIKKLDRLKFAEIRRENWQRLRAKHPHRRMPHQP